MGYILTGTGVVFWGHEGVCSVIGKWYSNRRVKIVGKDIRKKAHYLDDDYDRRFRSSKKFHKRKVKGSGEKKRVLGSGRVERYGFEDEEFVN